MSASKSVSDKAKRFWQVMTEIYGSQWLNEYSEQPNEQWAGEIERLSVEDITRGIEQCKRSGSPFVPRLPQFLAFCDEFYGDTKEQRAFNAQCKASEAMLALPKPQADPNIRKAALAEMKALLGSREKIVYDDAEKERKAKMIADAEKLLTEENSLTCATS